jgi:hypothetical protein
MLSISYNSHYVKWNYIYLKVSTELGVIQLFFYRDLNVIDLNFLFYSPNNSCGYSSKRPETKCT